jgi:predicted SprT family Zn-dependent metalloprotease
MKFNLNPYTNDELKDVYEHYRKKYFGSDIPPVEEICVKYSWEYLTAGDEAFLEIHQPIFHIHLRPGLKYFYSSTNLAVLHEQAHLKCYLKDKRSKGHGKLWRKEIDRLYSLGAFYDLI